VQSTLTQVNNMAPIFFNQYRDFQAFRTHTCFFPGLTGSCRYSWRCNLDSLPVKVMDHNHWGSSHTIQGECLLDMISDVLNERKPYWSQSLLWSSVH